MLEKKKKKVEDRKTNCKTSWKKSKKVFKKRARKMKKEKNSYEKFNKIGENLKELGNK